MLTEYIIADIFFAQPAQILPIEDVQTAFNIFLQNIHWVVIGTLIGMTLGVIPGMGGIVALSILIPLTIGMDRFQAFALLTGAVGATTFTGSITAILVSTPGTVSNAATLLDGYPLTQRGEANRAIGASALASASGALIAVAIFIILIPFIMDFALSFGAREQFWLVIWAVIMIPLLVGDKPLLGIATGLFGGLLAMVGRDPHLGRPRFTFDTFYLLDGVELLPVLIGLFAFAELINLASSGQSYIVEGGEVGGSRQNSTDGGREAKSTKVDGISDVIKHKFLWFRCALIGTFIGILPGVGGSTSSFIAYAHAVQSSLNPEEFGSGRIEGVIAAEAANDAKDGGQLVPTLGLGIPGSGSMAVFLGGMVVHGITPSPLIIVDNLHLVLMISFSLVLSNILTSVVGLLFTGTITKVLEIPIHRLLPIIMILGVCSIYIVRNSFLDVIVGILFGIVGVWMISADISRIPFIIALILIPLLENNYHVAVSLAGGNVLQGLFGSQIAVALFSILVLSILFYFVDVKAIVLGKLMSSR